MKPVMCLLTGVLLAGLLVFGGCGKKEEQPTRFNRTLGGTPVGAPTGTVQIDTGILQDPAAYKPQPYEPLEGAGPGGAAGGPEAEAIHDILRDLVVGIFEFETDTILDSFVPEQVAVLRQDDYMSTFYETKDTLDAWWAVFQEKATAPEFQPSVKLMKLLPDLADPLLDAITVTLEDEEHAVATFEGAQLELPENFATALEEMQAASAAIMSQLGLPGPPGGAPGGGPPPQPADPNAAAAAPAAAGTPAGGFSPEMLQENLADVQLSLPLRKTDEGWRLALPFAFQEEQADLLNEGLLLVKDYFADVTASIDRVETLDFQTYLQIERRQQGKVLALMGWGVRARAMLASMLEALPGEEGAEEPEAAEEEPSEPNAAEDPNAAESPEPGSGRRRP